MSKSVVIVGGSLAGLIHGLQHKRLGNNVTVIEQDPASERSSHQAGIGFGPSVGEFLRRYDATGLTPAFTCHHNHVAYRTRKDFLVTKGTRNLTSWGYLYRIMRANYDGFASSACPQPPPPREGDGEAAYLTGKRVTGLEYNTTKQTVTVQYEDVISGRQDTIEAELVLGADGVNSTVRRLLHGPNPQKQYAGYVSWRGTVPEKFVSGETARYFADHISFNLLKRSYIICYVIPTDDGDFGAGERLLNFVWYTHLAEGSDEMKEVFTDVNGQLHYNTVPQGLVRPAVWERARTAAQSLAAPFAELLAKVDQPFVTKINDVLSPRAGFEFGAGGGCCAVLVGDALAGLRPHTGGATEQAAGHALSLEAVYRGRVALRDWDREARMRAKRGLLASRLVGLFGTCSVFAFMKCLLSYFVLVVRCKIGWA